MPVRLRVFTSPPEISTERRPRYRPNLRAALLFLTVRPVARRVGRTLLIAVAVFGLGTIALGTTTSFVVAIAALWWTMFPALRDVDGFPLAVDE